jgi:hypothetical protein
MPHFPIWFLLGGIRVVLLGVLQESVAVSSSDTVALRDTANTRTHLNGFAVCT